MKNWTMRDSDENADFYRKINKTGWILEEAIFSTLQKRAEKYRPDVLKRSHVMQGVDGARKEIDALWMRDGLCLIIEAKKSSHVILALRAKENKKELSFFEVRNACSPKQWGYEKYPEDSYDIKAADVLILLPLLQGGASSEYVFQRANNKEAANIPSNEGMDKWIYQILQEEESLILESSTWNTDRLLLIPVLITNAPILYLEYSLDDIDDTCSLKEKPSQKKLELPWIACTHEYPMKYPEFGSLVEIKKDSAHTIIVVSQAHFPKFLDTIKA